MEQKNLLGNDKAVDYCQKYAPDALNADISLEDFVEDVRATVFAIKRKSLKPRVDLVEVNSGKIVDCGEEFSGGDFVYNMEYTETIPVTEGEAADKFIKDIYG